MTTLIIARHGNTFGPKDTPTRVGKHTDLPLVDKGRSQAQAIGHYLKTHHMIPDVAYTSNLKRTIETADIALKSAEVVCPIQKHSMFDEIDYGPDENKPEADVINRIGHDAIQAWDTHATVPNGWIANPDNIIKNWHSFSDSLRSSADASQRTILVVTSNGVARFAPYITGDFETFRQNHTIKLATGALGILKYQKEHWSVQGWNIQPDQDMPLN